MYLKIGNPHLLAIGKCVSGTRAVPDHGHNTKQIKIK